MEHCEHGVRFGLNCPKCNDGMRLRSTLKPLLADLENVSAGIDGRIDGHSWGQEHSGKNKVTIEDLIEIKEEIDNIIKKYKNG